MDSILTIGRFFLVRSLLGKKAGGVFLALVAGRKAHDWASERFAEDRLPEGQKFVEPHDLARYAKGGR